MTREIKQGYKAVVLSGRPAKDTTGFDLTGYFQYKASLSDHKQYWLKLDDEARGRVIEIISQDLMEQNYSEYRRGGYFSGNLQHSGRIAYHTNHGTAHGLRQKEHQTQYLNLIKRYGTPLYQEAATHLTTEELAIMQLAAYMHRLGRTNERSFQDDRLYGPRAAQIFMQVATELEFNLDLIALVAGTMNVFRSTDELQAQDNGQGPALQIKGLIDLPVGSARQKAILFERLIEIGHLTELVRCYADSRFSAVRESIACRLKGMLACPHQANGIAEAFLNMAAQFNIVTGAGVGMLPGKQVRENAELSVESAIKPSWTEENLARAATQFMNENEFLKRVSLLSNHAYKDQSAGIDGLLNDFESKIASVGQYHLSAKHKAQHLLATLREEKQKAFVDLNEESKALFLKNASHAIKEAIPCLQKDLGWGDYLKNLLKQLINAITTGLAFLGTFGMSKHRGFFSVKPSLVADRAKTLNSDLNDVVAASAPA